MLSAKFAVMLHILIVGVSFTQQWELINRYYEATPPRYNRRLKNDGYSNPSTTELPNYERTDQKKFKVSDSDTWLPGTYVLNDGTVLKLNPPETGENQESVSDFQVIENMLYGVAADNLIQLSALEGKIDALESAADRIITDLEETKNRINEINNLHKEILKKLERKRLSL